MIALVKRKQSVNCEVCVLEICSCLKRNCKDLEPLIVLCIFNSKW